MSCNVYPECEPQQCRRPVVLYSTNCCSLKDEGLSATGGLERGLVCEIGIKIDKSTAVCLCRNSGQKRRLNDVDEIEADTRRLNVDNSERSTRMSGQAAPYVTA